MLICNKKKYLYIYSFAFILLAGILYYLFNLRMISTTTDEAWLWFSAKKIAMLFPYNSFDHHTIRMGIIIPVVLTQLLFGFHPIVYYVSPFIMYMISLVFVFKISFKISNLESAVFSSFFFIVFTEINKASYQVMPEIFSCAYILSSFYFLLCYLDNNSKLHLSASSFLLFIAYLTKITNLFFLPVIIASFFLYKKRIKDLMIFLIPLAFLFLLETIIYFCLTGYITGALGIIGSSHLKDNNSLHAVSFIGLFDRLLLVSREWKILIASGLLSCAILFFRNKNKNILLLLLMIIIYILLSVFAIKSVNPITPFMPFRQRYFLVIAPLLITGLGVFICYIINILISKINVNFNLFQKKILSYCIIMVLLIGLIIYKKADTFSMSQIFKVDEIYKNVNRAYDDNIPIISGINDSKSLFVINCLFIKDRLKNKSDFYNDPDSWRGYKSLSICSSKVVDINNDKYNCIIKSGNIDLKNNKYLLIRQNPLNSRFINLDDL